MVYANLQRRCSNDYFVTYFVFPIAGPHNIMYMRTYFVHIQQSTTRAALTVHQRFFFQSITTRVKMVYEDFQLQSIESGDVVIINL